MQKAAIGLSIAGAGIAALCSPTGNFATAQDSTASDRSYVCMVRTKENGSEQPTRIVVPTRSIDVMLQKGFEEFECGKGFPSGAQLAFQKRVCRMAADHPEAMQKQFDRILGERPAVLCAMAEVALGQWDSREKPQ